MIVRLSAEAIRSLSRFSTTVESAAPCGLPCGDYDPAQPRIEAEAIQRIIAKVVDNDDADFRTRAVVREEQRSELVRHHLWVLWSDYFKPAQFEKYPQPHTLFSEAHHAGRHVRAPSTSPGPTNCSPRATRSSETQTAT